MEAQKIIHLCKCPDCGHTHCPPKPKVKQADRQCRGCGKTKPYKEFYTGGAPAKACKACRAKPAEEKPDRECVVCLKAKPYKQFYTGGPPSKRCHECGEAAKTQRIEKCSVCHERFWVPKSFVWYLGLKCEKCKKFLNES